MDRGHFDDDSPTLSVQAHGDSMVLTTRISATKSAPPRIDRLALTIKIHSDSSRSGTHLSTWINGSSMMTRRHSALGLPAIRSTTRSPSTQQNPRLGESALWHSPSKFTAIRVPVPPTYPHPEPRFDGSLADDRRSASQQSRAFSQPTSAHRKPRLAMRLLSLTVTTHSDPSVRTADISTSDAPQPGTDLLALTDRTHSKPTLFAATMPTSKPYTSGRHRAGNRAKNPRHPPVCPKAPNLPRARVPLRFDAATHRQKTQRFESLQRRPIHTRGRRPRLRQHDSSSKRRQPRQIAGHGYYRESAWRSRAYAPSSRSARIVRI